MASILVLLRHGQSEWNKKNIFTGWIDVGLSDEGVKEAKRAAEALRDLRFDAVFCSALRRAITTAEIALADQRPKDFYRDQALNERRYGDLEGQDKDEVRQKHGAEKVHLWRRSFDIRPPGGESLRDTCDRVLPYFLAHIEPRLKRGETVLISAHGNSLRALIKHLEKLSDQEIANLEVPTGRPIVYHLSDDLNIIEKRML